MLENRQNADEDRIVELEQELKLAKDSALEWDQRLNEV